MPKIEHKITLVERKDRAILQTKPDYDICVNGKAVEKLYYNMTGYVGAIPQVTGISFNIGERGLSTWKKEIGIANREAKEKLEAAAQDRRKVHGAFRTDEPSTVALLSMVAGEDPQVTFASRRHWETAIRLFGKNTPVGIGFFDEDRIPAEKAPTVLMADHHWLRRALPGLKTREPDLEEQERIDRHVAEIFKTADPETILVVGRHVDEDGDPEPYYVRELSYRIQHHHYGEHMRIADLRAAEPQPIPDVADRTAIKAMFPWFDCDAGEDLAMREHQNAQAALCKASRIRAGQGEKLDAAQRHEIEQEALTGPEPE